MSHFRNTFFDFQYSSIIIENAKEIKKGTRQQQREKPIKIICAQTEKWVGRYLQFYIGIYTYYIPVSIEKHIPLTSASRLTLYSGGQN